MSDRYAITIGAGLTRARGQYQRLSDATPEGLARVLSALPAVEEGWWSGHLWKDNRRSKERWLATSVIGVDIDYATDQVPSDEHRDALVGLATSGRLHGNLFHLTPHGARVAFMLDAPCSDRDPVLRASSGAAALITEAIAGSGYKLDTAPMLDLARLFFTPNAVAKGVERHADVLVMRRELYTVPELLAASVPALDPPPPAPAPVRTLRPEHAQDFDQAASRWTADHRRQYPRHSGECPVCHDKKSFGHLPEDPERWHCFSTDHPDGIGIRGANGYHGDALDLEAFDRRCKPVDVLRSDGYLAAPQRPPTPTPPPRAPAPSSSNAEPAPQPAAQGAFRPWRSRSYLTAVDIISKNARDVLDGRELERNEMSDDITVGRQLIHSADISRIRANIEARFVGGVDKNNNEIGLQLSLSDVERAVEQVAHAHPYHPVREYLSALKWDGVARLAHVAADIIGAAGTQIDNVIVRKFFVSAVARALEPGCKVDTVFVLVGPQGALKSSFFEVLGGAWFVDTPIDISSDSVRAYMTMRKAWILEFAELESLLRARDQNSVKAFLSSKSDNYVPKFSRFPVDVKRGGVIVGTWNPDDQGGFLNDPTGERRYWPLTTGPEIDLRTLREQRDQLWAESVAIFRGWVERGRDIAECPWWLSAEEKVLLAPVHDEHSTRDVWAMPVLDWLDRQGLIEEVTVQEILANALSVPRHQWTDRDSKRVARILRASGAWKSNPNKSRGKPRTWIRTGASDRGEKHE
jgi:predicted P-loop ATPase